MTTNATRTAADAAKMQEREELALDFISFQLENDVFFRVCEMDGDEITPQKMRTMYLSDLWSGKRTYKPYLLPTLETIEQLLNMTKAASPSNCNPNLNPRPFQIGRGTT